MCRLFLRPVGVSLLAVAGACTAGVPLGSITVTDEVERRDDDQEEDRRSKPDSARRAEDQPNAVDSASDCIERATPIAGAEPTALGLSADDVLRLAMRDRSGTLEWRDGDTTELTLAVSSAEAFLIDSEPNPLNVLASEHWCRDRVAVSLRAHLATADGRLNEDVELIASAVDDGRELVSRSANIEKESFRGSYVETSFADDECHWSTHVSLSLSEGEFSGELLDQYSDDPCDEPLELVAVGERTGGRW